LNLYVSKDGKREEEAATPFPSSHLFEFYVGQDDMSLAELEYFIKGLLAVYASSLPEPKTLQVLQRGKLAGILQIERPPLHQRQGETRFDSTRFGCVRDTSKNIWLTRNWWNCLHAIATAPVICLKERIPR
jgi:hypothetical protein